MMTPPRIVIPDEVLPPDAGNGSSRPVRRRRSSRRQRTRRARRLLALLALVALGLVGLAWAVVPALETGPLPSLSRPYSSVTEAVVPEPPLRATRRIYPFSVVPGGVGSRAELRYAVSSDPVVAAHYDGIDVAAAVPTRVTTPRAVHVSYRMGDRVYWTRDKVWLKPGELLLSDGANEVRGRCGNRIGDVPGEVAPQEPPPEVFEEPVPEPVQHGGIAPLPGYHLLFFDTPPESPSQPLPDYVEPLPVNPVPIIPPPGVVYPEWNYPPPPSGPIPEPSTLVLLGTGGAALALRRRRRRREG